MIDFGCDICNDLSNNSRREWLVTNGIGGYASGTLGGILTRRYHGLLVAALETPLGRTLLVTKLDETVSYDEQSYSLFANRWSGDVVEPQGFVRLEQFRLEGTTPVWTFAFCDALLEKRIWMQQGENTTYTRYDFVRGTLPVQLSLKALVNYRDYHSSTHAGDWHMNIEAVTNGICVNAFDSATPFYLFSKEAKATLQHDWYRNFELSVEAYRGLDKLDDHLYGGEFNATLQPGKSLMIVASTQATPALEGKAAYDERQAYEARIVMQSGLAEESDYLKQLVLAADQFIVKRALADDPNGRSIIAGYPWFGDWGRDTMISLPGLTLATGRFDDAAKILRTFARFVDQGMLPNRFPDAGETPEYNTADATLWYIEAIRAYVEATHDEDLLRDLFPVLEDIIAWHERGTRYQIHVDPADGLLYVGEAGVQLTWMDAKVGDYVVTPRIGKPVEINALWYNALSTMTTFAKQLRKSAKHYSELAEKVKTNFKRFWNEEAGYLYDVMDGPNGNDASLRPNQLLAVSLTHSPLSSKQQRAVVDICARKLLTSNGLRSLDKDNPAYIGHYGGDAYKRDTAYHQGTVWSWLLGPFVSAHFRVYNDAELARTFLHPLEHHLQDAGLGSISEIFDGDAPFTARGCFAQAWGVGEILRVHRELQATALVKPMKVQPLRKKPSKGTSNVNV